VLKAWTSTYDILCAQCSQGTCAVCLLQACQPVKGIVGRRFNQSACFLSLLVRASRHSMSALRVRVCSMYQRCVSVLTSKPDGALKQCPRPCRACLLVMHAGPARAQVTTSDQHLDTSRRGSETQGRRTDIVCVTSRRATVVGQRLAGMLATGRGSNHIAPEQGPPVSVGLPSMSILCRKRGWRCDAALQAVVKLLAATGDQDHLLLFTIARLSATISCSYGW
jgi:hypothetical protein